MQGILLSTVLTQVCSELQLVRITSAWPVVENTAVRGTHTRVLILAVPSTAT